MLDFKEELRRYDFSFFAVCSVIFFIGILNLYSATHSETVGPEEGLYKSQLLWFVISWAIGIVVSFIQPKNLFRLSYLAYFISVFLLIVVLVVGHSALGGQRWIVLGPIKFQLLILFRPNLF